MMLVAQLHVCDVIMIFPILLQDINECDEENGNCSQFCNNTIGSYQCYCEDGYTLDSDEHTCNGIHITLFLFLLNERNMAFSFKTVEGLGYVLCRY